MATLDVLDSTEALAAISEPSADTTLLAAYVSAVSLHLDEIAGPVVQRSVTDTHDGGRSSVWLTGRPVSSITTVVEDGTTLTTSDWHARRRSSDSTLFTGEVVRVSGDSAITWTSGLDKVVITYVAGRFADTASVDERFKDAARLLLQNAWRAQQHAVRGLDEYDVPSTSFRKFGLPNAVRDILAGELRASAHGIAVA